MKLIVASESRWLPAGTLDRNELLEYPHQFEVPENSRAPASRVVRTAGQAIVLPARYAHDEFH